MESLDKIFLLHALSEAKKAFYLGEVPVGAVIVKDGKIISKGFNSKEFLQKSTAHAEIIAIERACEKLGSWRLEGCTLYTTLEPCIMCCGAILQARIERVVYSAKDPKFGGVESLYRLLDDERLNHRVKVERIELKEAEELLKRFFRYLRSGEVPEPGLTGPIRNRVCG